MDKYCSNTQCYSRGLCSKGQTPTNDRVDYFYSSPDIHGYCKHFSYDIAALIPTTLKED